MNNKTLNSLSDLTHPLTAYDDRHYIDLNLFSGGKVFESCGFPRVKRWPVAQDVLLTDFS